MKQIFSTSLFLAVFSLLYAPYVLALEQAPSPPAIAAKAWLLIDHDSGEVLAQHNADQPLPPASLTKLMTAYLLFEKIKSGKLSLTETVEIGATAWNAKGARLLLRPEAKVAVEDLIKGMLVHSANDATLALVERVSHGEAPFVAEMNAKARDLGLHHTVFANATGLDRDGQVSTARDLSRLAGMLIRDFPEYYPWFGLKEFTYNEIKQYNRNALLWRDASVDGIKSGQTRAAGYCLIVSANRDRMRLIATVMGAKDETERVTAAQKLIDYGFRYFETRLLYAADAAATHVRVWMGDANTLPLGVGRDLYLTLPRGWHQKLHARLTVTKDVRFAPISLGQKFGTLTLELDQMRLREYPLVALKEIGEGNLLQSGIDRIRLWLQ